MVHRVTRLDPEPENVGDAHRWEVQDRFWASLEVVDASAVGLFHLITKHFDAMEVPFSKLFTYASDGASVVASKLGGLAGLLTQRIN